MEEGNLSRVKVEESGEDERTHLGSVVDEERGGCTTTASLADTRGEGSRCSGIYRRRVLGGPPV